MIRPHPSVWKFVHGCAMLYLLALVFLLMQGKTAARHAMKVRHATRATPWRCRPHSYEMMDTLRTPARR